MSGLDAVDIAAKVVLAACVSRALWVWLTLADIGRHVQMLDALGQHARTRDLLGAASSSMSARRRATTVLRGALWIPAAAALPLLWLSARWWGAL